MSLEVAVALAYGVPTLIFAIICGFVFWIEYRDGGMPPAPDPPDFVAIAKSRTPTNQ